MPLDKTHFTGRRSCNFQKLKLLYRAEAKFILLSLLGTFSFLLSVTAFLNSLHVSNIRFHNSHYENDQQTHARNVHLLAHLNEDELAYFNEDELA